MKRWSVLAMCGMLWCCQAAPPSLAETNSRASGHPTTQQLAEAQSMEAGANVVGIPKQILKTGIDLNATSLSPNSVQLANTIGMTSIAERIQDAKARIDRAGAVSLEGLSARQDLYDARQQAGLLIQKTELEIDFVSAEISAEQNVYSELLDSYTGERDKKIFRANALSFLTNGILWAACEGLDIPTYRVPTYSIPSGILGIAAGIVPSIASGYTLYAVRGPRRTSEVDPNMLARLFGYQGGDDVEYPKSVWGFLHQVPADQPNAKSRIDQIIDRWIADANISNFSDRTSRTQLDVITACRAQKKGMSIATLNARQVMLTQLSAEINKMKRMLLELAMVVSGDKMLVAREPSPDNIEIGAARKAISFNIPPNNQPLDRDLMTRKSIDKPLIGVSDLVAPFGSGAAKAVSP